MNQSTSSLKKRSGARLPSLDLLRGAALTLMVFHHAIMNVRYLYGLDLFAFQEDYWFIGIGRPLVLVLFLLVSGVSSVFSKNNMKRGFRMLVFAFLMTLTTWLINRYVAPLGVIYFNVIHVIALSVLLYAMITRPSPKNDTAPANDITALPDAVGREDVRRRDRTVVIFIAVGVAAIFLAILLDPILPASSNNGFLLMLGVPPTGRDVMDGMSLFPWLGFFMIGAAIGLLRYPRWENREPAPAPEEKGHAIYGKPLPWIARPFCFLGRHGLWVYVLHQPILFTFLFLVLGRPPI